MIASVERSALAGDAYVPPSKSYTHRAILITAMGDGGAVNRPLLSADTKATISAAVAFGAKVEGDSQRLSITGVSGEPRTPENVIDVLNSGTTLRFCSAVAALTDGAVLTGDASIRQRPNGPLLKSLNSLGAQAFSIRKNDRAPIVVVGKMLGGRCMLDGSVSSQFLSAMLIACPMAEKDTEIQIIGELKSRPYAEITMDMLREAGACVRTDGPKFHVTGGSKYNLRSFSVPGDFSSASYLLAGAAVTGSKVRILGLYPSRQGDSAIVSILQRMGMEISWDKEAGILTAEGAKNGGIHGIEVDASLTPDLVPTVAVLGAVASGHTTIFNAEHVRHKETDRLHAMATELSKMGAIIKERPDGLEIDGAQLHGAHVSGYHDHRIVMALCIAGLTCGGTFIETAESVDVSFPGFFETIQKLGGAVKVAE
jgi:3-phosphoshikimate 1-carboxyvinyltransferase